MTRKEKTRLKIKKVMKGMTEEITLALTVHDSTSYRASDRLMALMLSLTKEEWDLFSRMNIKRLHAKTSAIQPFTTLRRPISPTWKRAMNILENMNQ